MDRSLLPLDCELVSVGFVYLSPCPYPLPEGMQDKYKLLLEFHLLWFKLQNPLGEYFQDYWYSKDPYILQILHWKPAARQVIVRTGEGMSKVVKIHC